MTDKEIILTAAQMQRFDKETTEIIGIPAAVLMERAALAATEEITKRYPVKNRVLVVTGKGNNGGDGLAIARLLLLLGYNVEVYLAWNSSQKNSEENERQLQILRNTAGVFVDAPDFSAYDVIVDALFGIGFQGTLRAPYDQLVQQINKAGAQVVAVDIPSGLDADTGVVKGNAVKAALTVTFGYRKKAHVLEPACGYCGEVVLRDVGIYCNDSLWKEPYCFTSHIQLQDQKRGKEQKKEKKFLPERNLFGNKGTFGKLLVIAGSGEVGGAAILAAGAAFSMGIGMVKVCIHKNQKDILLQSLPECMVMVYDDNTTVCEMQNMLSEAVDWCDGILVGPGIGTGMSARCLVQSLLDGSLGQKERPLLMDADALNILAQEGEPLLSRFITYREPIVITPHMGEFGRLLKQPVGLVKERKEDFARDFAGKYHCTVVAKDARTFVAAPDENGVFINETGNDGMACAGSGDVLSGIMAVLLIQCDSAFEAACKAVLLHGMAGDSEAKKTGKRSLRASDLVSEVRELVFEIDNKEL